MPSRRVSRRKSTRKNAKRVSRKSSRKNSRKVSRKRTIKRRVVKKASNETARILKFTRSSNPNKKYDAHLSNGRKVAFGAKGYQHFKDRTPLKLYKSQDHLDPTRRRSYKARHSAIKTRNGKKATGVKNSPAYLSLKYLW